MNSTADVTILCPMAMDRGRLWLPKDLWAIVREYRPRKRLHARNDPKVEYLVEYEKTFSAVCFYCGYLCFFIRLFKHKDSDTYQAACLLCCPWRSRKSKARMRRFLNDARCYIGTFGDNFCMLEDYGHIWDALYIDYSQYIDELSYYWSLLDGYYKIRDIFELRGYGI
jgi:hypothetical protein